ncbi:EAL domain-containing response regulator [Massilia yuzhufengensis]|uniref:EAL domain, c-di-GMP-specific phosphodiesterase class I (Or its enzymatically inactive variant) n=1 Tax=Massilia yuzhufengensis TaxID=1164594 RepID=A0A1I1J5G0_9BURK|nr:EAL domain-containing response regulator [Massilia yuzhufengensis]SFC43849.1 EAL domain, c-di-GMP-specific phosphodiesterase class I (or its enzymatically inactive variant) [Massilia yuzhufengensis]
MDIAHLHFLVAEADAAQRRTLVELLGQLGASRVTDVPDGHLALQRLDAGFTPRVDVAIVDLALPGMDGLELIRNLGLLGGGVRLVVTGAQPAGLLFSVETLAQAYGVDLLGSIAKPVTAVKLKPLLENYTPPVRLEDRPAGPRFGFQEIGIGLQKRQFEPFFQPKIELATGQVKGLEAFARWRHPEHGVLGPGAFMDALEQNNRVDFLDWSMIELSSERCRWFQDQGLPISISINLAPETLAHPAFVRQITACVQRHRILPEYLTFEMPESSVLNTDPEFIERLVRLRMMGFGLAIDDYGTGRSNLQLLARIPFSELKIDRSFVDGASKRRPLGTVLRSCLGLAHSLDRMSVAVGVETRQDWDFLQNLGCTYAQGYHIANPMEAAAFPGWLEDWRHFF